MSLVHDFAAFVDRASYDLLSDEAPVRDKGFDHTVQGQYAAGGEVYETHKEDYEGFPRAR